MLRVFTHARLLCFVSTWMRHLHDLAPLTFSSSLRCFARLLPVGQFLKKNVVWKNVSENLLVKFLHSSFTAKKVFVHWQGTSFLFWLSIVESRMKVKPIVQLVTLIKSKPALFRFLVHVLVCSQSLRLTMAQVFLLFLPWPNNFCALCIAFHCQNKNHKKSKLCRQVSNEFQREHAARPHAGIFSDTYIRRHLSLMRQQHAFSLSTRLFLPRRHFASALSRQGRLLFWLISVFLLFVQNKSQGRHNITTYPKKSTAVSTMVHKPTTAVTKPRRRSKRSEDE